MNSEDFADILKDSPIVVAIKDDAGLEKCVNSRSKIVFILYGKVSNISSIVEKVHSAGKIPFVHIDFIDGLSPREAAVDFIKNSTKASGIISTKAPIIRYAKSVGMLAIQRFFVLDSISLINIPRQLKSTEADAIEILPGLIPKVITRLIQEDVPVIAGGLISDKNEVIQALTAGATSVSSTNENVWFM